MADKNATETFKDPQHVKKRYEVVSGMLRDIYGELEWHQGQSPIEELVSCILSQNTNDNNRDKAFDALQAKYRSWQAVVSIILIENRSSLCLSNRYFLFAKDNLIIFDIRDDGIPVCKFAG